VIDYETEVACFPKGTGGFSPSDFEIKNEQRFSLSPVVHMPSWRAQGRIYFYLTQLKFQYMLSPKIHLKISNPS
jgi:hypothetical protein